MNIFNRLQQLIFKKSVKLDLEAQTIAKAFSYPEDEFAFLVADLSDFIDLKSTIISFSNYLSTSTFKKFNLNLSKPKDTMLLGYAFCLAVLIKIEQAAYRERRISEVLNVFNNNKKTN